MVPHDPDNAVVSPNLHLALVRAGAEPDLSALAAERRAHERLTISALAWLNEVRLKYGPLVSLIDLSVGGAQIEITSHRLEPGRTVVIEMTGLKGELSVPARVLRCGISSLAPQVTYRGALAFKQPLELPAAAENASHADANPLHEHARLTLALRRAARASAGGGDGISAAGAAALLAARGLIASPSARRAGAPYAREMSRFIRTITGGLENGLAADKLLQDIPEQLRRAVPARSIRLLDGAGALAGPSAEAMRFDVPSAAKAMQLVVEFPQDCRVEDWHLQLLKTAAHLIAANQEVSGAHAKADAATEPPEERELVGWHRLVVRYRDGRMLKGLGRDFYPAKGHIHVWPVIDAPAASRISVRLAHLKAVFFVHDFDGAPPQVEAAAPASPLVAGRRIIVTFMDGEVLDATTLNYSAEAPGFFVSPSDTTSNNERIFVINEAVRHVQFP